MTKILFFVTHRLSEGRAAPLFVPPAAFSRMDQPQEYQYRRDTAGQKTVTGTPLNIIGRTRQRRTLHAIFVNYDVEKVPAKPSDVALNQVQQGCSAQWCSHHLCLTLFFSSKSSLSRATRETVWPKPSRGSQCGPRLGSTALSTSPWTGSRYLLAKLFKFFLSLYCDTVLKIYRGKGRAAILFPFLYFGS